MRDHCTDSYSPVCTYSVKNPANCSTCVTLAKALRITYNTNAGLIPWPSWPQLGRYNDPAHFPYGTRVILQSAPGSYQSMPSSMFDFEYNRIYNMQNLQRLDLFLGLSSTRFALLDKQRDHIWKTAVSLSKVAVSILNIEVYFSDWYR